MKLNNFDLLSVIQKCKTSNLTRGELNFLIEKSYQISISFLKSKFKHYLNSFNSDIKSLEDIASDSIVPLFTKNSSNRMGISRSLEKWKDDLKDLGDAEYFLSRIIWRRVDQTVTKVLKERDPIFEKIIKTLNICIQNNHYKKARYFGTVYVLQKSDSKIFGQVIEEDNFNLIPEVYFGLKQSELFNKLFRYLVSETVYYPAVPLNILVKRIKFYHSKRLALHLDHSGSHAEFISLEEIVNDGLIGLKEKLDTYYVSNSKLNKNEAELIYAAFNDISKDMLNGGINDSLFLYLKGHLESLDKNDFYRKYHHIMNYLLTRFKSNVASNIYF